MTASNTLYKYRSAGRLPWELEFPGLLRIVYFQFQTVEEADSLAEYLSSLYPVERQNLTKLGLNEIFINAIEHGNLGITAAEKINLKKTNLWHEEFKQRFAHPVNSLKTVWIVVEVTPSYIRTRIKDEGQGFDWQSFDTLYASSMERGGRGLLLAKELCFDKIEFSAKGNEVCCISYLN